MANCKNCSAPLPPHTSICKYCHTKNDVDLKGIGDYSVDQPDSKRLCPRCEKPMQTIKIKAKDKLYIEQCKECYGLFFDPGELEYLLSQSVSNVFDIDYKRLGQMVGNRREDYDVKYIKCPVCDKFMNRLNFGARSGVIVDKCKEHGIWLDGGELRQIMEWTKAGGKLFDEEKKSEAKKIEDFREKQKARDFAIESAKSNKDSAYSFTLGKRGFDNTPMSSLAGEDLVGLLIRFVRRFF